MSGPTPQPAQARAIQVDVVPPGTANEVRFGGTQVQEISPKSSNIPAARNPLQQTNSPTPGVDDTPYIRFAIDQLTRDEEVAGAGRQGSVITEEDLGERLIGDEGLGYFQQVPLETNQQKAEQQQQRQSLLEQAERPRSSSRLQRSDLLVAVEPEESDYRYPPLAYVPHILRPGALGLAVFACSCAIAGIAFCNVWSQRHQGLLDYTGTLGSRYFLFQFLPQLLAAILVFWTFIIQAAVYRITPFSIMASERQVPGVLQNLSLLPRNFLLPDFSHFRQGEPLVGFALFGIWLTNFLAIPILSCFFQAKYYYIAGDGHWRWTAVQAIGWTAIALYALLTLSLSMLLFRFCRSWTGLMWDPVSMADLIPMVQRSNILRDFHETETAVSVNSNFLQPRVLRLGYWREMERPEIFYGIGEEYSPAGRPSSFSSADTREKRPATASSPMDRERQAMLQNDEAFERGLHSPFTRYRYTVWFLRDYAIFAWIGIVFGLFTALVVVSFVKDAIPHGFPPLLPTLTSAKGFSSSNFLYSFLPALIGNVLYLAWQPIDTYLRALQPFSGLCSTDGATAADSLLLSYPTQSHFEAVILSLGSRHWKVACTSFIGFISIAIPITAGGVFMALFYAEQNEIRIAACLPAYYTLIGFCGLYALSFVTIWPRRCRYLPHAIYTLADQISFLYQSPLLADKVVGEPRSKSQLVTRLVVTIPGQRDGSRFGFGVLRGLDGNEHLGIDRVFRPGQAEMLIMGW